MLIFDRKKTYYTFLSREAGERNAKNLSAFNGKLGKH